MTHPKIIIGIHTYITVFSEGDSFVIIPQFSPKFPEVLVELLKLDDMRNILITDVKHSVPAVVAKADYLIKLKKRNEEIVRLIDSGRSEKQLLFWEESLIPGIDWILESNEEGSLDKYLRLLDTYTTKNNIDILITEPWLAGKLAERIALTAHDEMLVILDRTPEKKDRALEWVTYCRSKVREGELAFAVAGLLPIDGMESLYPHNEYHVNMIQKK